MILKMQENLSKAKDNGEIENKKLMILYIRLFDYVNKINQMLKLN